MAESDPTGETDAVRVVPATFLFELLPRLQALFELYRRRVVRFLGQRCTLKYTEKDKHYDTETDEPIHGDPPTTMGA